MSGVTKNIIIIFVSILFFSGMIFCQQRGLQGGGIFGNVYDSITKGPIEYANIIVFTSKDSIQQTGTVSNKEGKFNLTGLNPGNYYVDIQFIGYEKHRVNNVKIPNTHLKVDLGNIFLKPSTVNLDNVVVEGTRSPITYQIDKKVIDVSQLGTVISGNAADVLENVPSVTVDIDGNVSLRGSTNFTVLIDGKPTVMDPQDVLQQIPASSIENMEIITNPSAKYDPEGNAGIINIKLKKNKNLGLSGIANANAGVNDKYGGDFLFQYRTSSLNYNFGVDYNRRFFDGTRTSREQFLQNGITSYLNSDGNHNRGRISFGVRGGLDFDLGVTDQLSLGGRYGTRKGQRYSDLNYLQWDQNSTDQIYYLSHNDSYRDGNSFEFNTNYSHKFNLSGHEITSQFVISSESSDESSVSSELQNSVQTNGKETTENGPSTEIEGKIEYVLPFAEKNKFEAGTVGQMDLSKDNTGLYEYNSESNTYVFQPLYSNSTKYNRSNLAVYTLYSDEISNFGYQFGIRGEYTYRTIELTKTNQLFSIDRWDVFPTLHSSYKISDGSQIMASYTKRIHRPHGWALEPFDTWMDANNVRRGNPGLQPEYIDSYELGFQTFFLGATFSNDFYYRNTRNVIERVKSVYSDLVTLNTFDNVGKDYSLGTEFMLSFDLFKFWSINLMGDLYDYRIKGSLLGNEFSRSSFNWNSNFNNSFKITKSTQLQFNVRYHSPSVSSQGRRESFFTTDAALKQDFLNRMIALTFQVRDLFQTGKFEFTSDGIDFNTYTLYKRESPMFMLNVRINFNNYKNKEGERGGDQQNGFGNEEDY